MARREATTSSAEPQAFTKEGLLFTAKTLLTQGAQSGTTASTTDAHTDQPPTKKRKLGKAERIARRAAAAAAVVIVSLSIESSTRDAISASASVTQPAQCVAIAPTAQPTRATTATTAATVAPAITRREGPVPPSSSRISGAAGLSAAATLRAQRAAAASLAERSAAATADPSLSDEEANEEEEVN